MTKRSLPWNHRVEQKLNLNKTGLSRFQIYKCRKCGDATVFSFRICAVCLDSRSTKL